METTIQQLGTLPEDVITPEPDPNHDSLTDVAVFALSQADAAEGSPVSFMRLGYGPLSVRGDSDQAILDRVARGDITDIRAYVQHECVIGADLHTSTGNTEHRGGRSARATRSDVFVRARIQQPESNPLRTQVAEGWELIGRTISVREDVGERIVQLMQTGKVLRICAYIQDETSNGCLVVMNG